MRNYRGWLKYIIDWSHSELVSVCELNAQRFKLDSSLTPKPLPKTSFVFLEAPEMPLFTLMTFGIPSKTRTFAHFGSEGADSSSLATQGAKHKHPCGGGGSGTCRRRGGGGRWGVIGWTWSRLRARDLLSFCRKATIITDKLEGKRP